MRILIFLMAFLPLVGMAQTKTMIANKVVVKDTFTLRNIRVHSISADTAFLSASDQVLPTQRAVQRFVNNAVASGSASYNGNRAITGALLTGQNLGTTSNVQAFLDAAFFPSQVPTAALTSTYSAVTTSAQVLELMASGAALSVTLNWSSGRQASTQPLASTVVNGTTVTSAPSAGASVSGTLSASVTRNTNTTFTNVVTTTDSKTATATATFAWLPKRYWGSNVGAPSSAQIVAGTNEFSSVMAKGAFSITVGGTASNVFYAYPTSFGTLTSINIGGFESISAFTRTTVSVTNASGYVQNYYVYTSNNQFTSTTISFNSVN